MKISEIPNELWKAKRDVLEDAISHFVPDGGRIRRSTDQKLYNTITLEGYTMAMSFNCDEGRLYVWNRNLKYSGKLVSVKTLCDIESVIQYWYQREILEYFGGLKK